MRVQRLIANESIAPLGLKSRIYCFFDNTRVQFSAGMTLLGEQSTDGCSCRTGVRVEPHHMLAAAAGFLDEHHSAGAERVMALTNFGDEANDNGNGGGRGKRGQTSNLEAAFLQDS